MSATVPTYLYKEARANIEPAYPGSTIAIALPAHGVPVFGSRPDTKRTVITESCIDQNEEAFANHHLASEASMFFRRTRKYPKSFLWRILDGRKTLEIQSADLDHDESNLEEANLTIRLQFPSPIRPFGLAFAEPADKDALTVFALTGSCALYTITLHRDFFMKTSASEADVGDWCKTYKPSCFSLRTPYRLVATSANELLISLDDGSILKLVRTTRDGNAWMETLFKENTWSLLGSLGLTRKETIRYNGVEYDPSAAAAIALSPDEKHMLTVTLDHKLRIWNVGSGRVTIQVDLLGEEENPNEKVTPYYIGASQPTLMSVLDIQGGINGAQYHIVTYSPKQRQFKFWGIRDADDAALGIVDTQSEVVFVPPVDELMNTNVWNMEEFFINPGNRGWRGSEFWLRARSGGISAVYSVKFDLEDETSRVNNAWQSRWVSVDSGPLTVEGLRLSPSNPTTANFGNMDIRHPGANEQWLDFLFYPNRFTRATLETALVIYRRSLEANHPNRKVGSKGSLKERICTTVAVLASSGDNSDFEYLDYEERLASQWQVYYGLVKDLHKRRGECLSLTFDPELGMPWLVLADYLSAIRKCSELELINLNSSHFSPSAEPSISLQKAMSEKSYKKARVMHAASLFRKSFPRSFHRNFQDEVNQELLQPESASLLDRMGYLEQTCDLCDSVSDEDWNALVEDLGTHIQSLTTELFLEILELFDSDGRGKSNPKKQVTRYGLKLLTRISQETLAVDKEVLLDNLVLILFLQCGLGEEELSDEFDPTIIFVEIRNMLKDKSVTAWMTSTLWAHPASTGRASTATMARLNETFTSSRLPIEQTVMEGIFGHRCVGLTMGQGRGSELLTRWTRSWLADVYMEQNYDQAVDYVFGVLLSQKEYHLAQEFAKYLEERTWSEYLKGRMYLAIGEYAAASASFRKAAFNLALGMFSIQDSDTINLIPVNEHDSFSRGLPRFYLHVVGLFEKAKAPAYIVAFAKLGVQTLTRKDDPDLKMELLSRTFSASIQSAKFEQAYSALMRYTDTTLQKSALKTLVTAMVQNLQAPLLLKWPFGQLWNEVDSLLSELCHMTLNVTSGPPYHQTLYAFRISRNDFRGAAAILYDRLQRLKGSSSKVHDPANESMIQCYMLIINTLSSVSDDQAYILAERRLDDPTAAPVFGIGQAKKMLKRQIVTLDMLRKEYAAELDRVAAIESGQFPFVEAGDEMDIL